MRMRGVDLMLLIALARRGGVYAHAIVTTHELGKEIGVSQQTASRKLRELEKKGYLIRETFLKGQRIRLSSKGIKLLKKVYADLKEVFDESFPFIFKTKAKIVSGLGEGKYYMQIPAYQRQFEKKLGFIPFPGTLNLRLYEREGLRLRYYVEKHRGIEIRGFSYDERTFGGVKCFRAEVDGIEGAVIFPERSHHGFDVVEFISKVHVKKEKNLKDGDEVWLKIIFI